MNKIIVLAFLALAVFALQADFAHDQVKPVTAPGSQTKPVQPAQPAPKPTGPKPHPHPVKNNAPSRRVGYEAEIGDPFGREGAIKRTCFQAPCYEPKTGCGAPKQWRTVFYLVPTSTGQKGRFIGYECK